MRRNIVILKFFLLFTGILNAHPGNGIVMDSRGNVFYTDLSHVWKISPDGKHTVAVHNVHTHELYIDEQDDLYGEHEWYEGEHTDKWGNYVWCLSRDGLWEKTIQDVEGFLENNTLVRDPAGNSYWSKETGNYELLQQSGPDGETRSLTAHKFTDIRWMHYSKFHHALFVVDMLSVNKITLDGKVELISDQLKERGQVFNKVDDRHYVYGLWADLKKNLFIAIYGSGKVVMIKENGEFKTIYKSSIGWSPCGGVCAADGTIWLMEFSLNNKTRIKRISPSGDQKIFSRESNH